MYFNPKNPYLHAQHLTPRLTRRSLTQTRPTATSRILWMRPAPVLTGYIRPNSPY
jgi:hypothetical protein